jgi:hypothetical protein
MMRQIDQLPGMEDPPDAATVAELVGTFKRSEAIVGRWSKAKAETILNGLRREAALAANKAAARAGADPAGLDKPRPVSTPERLMAADYLEQALVRGPFEVALALSYAVMDLQNDEQRRLASFMVGKFRESTGPADGVAEADE